MQCEICQEKEGSLYCIACKTHYCSECDKTSHPDTHSSVLVQSQYTCAVHNLPLTSFCTFCSKLICADCYFEHHELSHTLVSIQAAYHTSLSGIHALLSLKGHPRKEKLEGRIGHRKIQIKELQKARTRIGEEMESSYDAILKRLELKVHPWILKLAKEQEDIKTDLYVYSQAMDLLKNTDKLSFLQ